LYESPLKKSKHRSRLAKLAKISRIGKKSMKLISPNEDVEWIDCDSLICESLKPLLENCSYQQRVSYLTLAAAAKWTAAEMVDFFGVPRHSATAAIRLFNEHGLLAKIAPPKNCNLLPESTLNLVKEHYLDSENSKELPGIKDRVIVRESGSKVYLQKRLIMHTLKFLFDLFLFDHPEIKVGFTKFTQLRPPQCVFAGGPGTLIICVPYPLQPRFDA